MHALWAILNCCTVSYVNYGMGSTFEVTHSLGRTWVSPTLVKWCPPQSMYVCMYVCIYVCVVHDSINKCLHALIHWTALILQCIINSVSAKTFKYLRLLQFCTCNGCTQRWQQEVCACCCQWLMTWHSLDIHVHAVHWVGQLQLPWAKRCVSKNKSYTWVLLDNWLYCYSCNYQCHQTYLLSEEHAAIANACNI